MLLNILLFIAGIVLIVSGANFLTDGAAALSRRFGLSPLMVGLTVVAFGTSAPELAVSISSALAGNSDLSLGNVVGSNIFNILGIVGITAMVAPLTITKGTIRKEIPLMILASIVVTALTFDQALSGLSGQLNILSRTDGLVLLSLFLIFLAYTIAISKVHGDPVVENVVDDPNKKKKPLTILLIFIIGGLVALVAGGDLFVSSASAIAEHLGVSHSIIALTIVSAGTSLPELATSIAAALKGEQEMAVGNVVGSNLLNICLVLGTTAVITPIGLGGLTGLDFTVMLASAVMLYFFGVFFGDRTITRIEGAILTLGYVGYTIYLITQI